MAHPSHGHVRTTPHEVNRLIVDVAVPYQEFRTRYETAVPHLQAERFDQMKQDEASWRAVREATTTNAPHDFIIYWSHDFSPLMRLAGHQQQCVGYLMGNQVVEEQMYGHDPAVMLYAPLRAVIYTDDRGTTKFTVDQPSNAFSSFGDPEITRIGLQLDHELAALLEYLDAPVPAELGKT